MGGKRQGGIGEKMGKTKGHTQYRLENKKRVPGATTITGILNKPALVGWANRLGLQGIDSSKYVDEKARVGTLAHEMIMKHLKGEELDTRDYTPNQVSAAENCVLSYFEWEKTNKPTPILIEPPLVSEEELFGGTPDLLAKIVDKIILIDFKTGKAIYPEYFYQLAAYKILVEEWLRKQDNLPDKIDGAKILRIGRDETESFEDRFVSDLTVETEIFLHCKAIYELRKKGAK